MSYTKALAGFVFIVIILFAALAPIPVSRYKSVESGHDHPATSHLTQGTRKADGRIVRNVILGNAIPVCSDELPISTAAAAGKWNRFFQHTVFQLEDDGTVFESIDPECTIKDRRSPLGIDSVLVTRDLDPDPDPMKRKCVFAACIFRALSDPHDGWDTITGQPTIYVGKHKEVDGNTGNVVEKDLGDDNDTVTRSITHELGHIFGLANYANHCKPAPMNAQDPINYTQRPTIMGAPLRPDGSEPPCYSDTPTSKDVADYRLSYIPTDPVALQELSGPSGPRGAIVSWDAFSVHVESIFAIEHKTKDDKWEAVATHDPLPYPESGPTPDPMNPNLVLQQASVALTGQVSGLQFYRVVALTKAPLQNSVAASGEIAIHVEAPPPPFVICSAPGPNPRSTDPGDPPVSDCDLSAPSNLRVDPVSATSATLRWNDVPEATGYKVRLDGIANTTVTLGDVNSYRFTGLTAGTAHVLEVASSTSDGDSEFASLTLLVPPTILATSTTSSSITLNWGSVTGATGYDLKQFAFGGTCDGPGVNGHTSLLNFTFTQGLSASTNYVVCIRASNLQGASAWASTTAHTKAPPPPPKELESPGVNCLTSRDTGVNIAWRTCCSSTRAATLLSWLVAAGDSVVGVFKWDGSQWLRYARVDGMLVPGSTNFSISGGAVLWLVASTSTRADGAWTPPPTPTPEELARLAELAAK